MRAKGADGSRYSSHDKPRSVRARRISCYRGLSIPPLTSKSLAELVSWMMTGKPWGTKLARGPGFLRHGVLK